MAKETFYSVSGGGYFGIGQVMKHIGQSSLDGEVGSFTTVLI
jgi:hypothetical protein